MDIGELRGCSSGSGVDRTSWAVLMAKPEDRMSNKECRNQKAHTRGTSSFDIPCSTFDISFKTICRLETSGAAQVAR
jgi:hypothetical protein